MVRRRKQSDQHLAPRGPGGLEGYPPSASASDTGHNLCQTETGAGVRASVVCKIALAADGKAPSEVPLFPAPDTYGKINARDGRVFLLVNPAQLCDDFNSAAHDVPLDFEHASEIKAPMGDMAPAAGWITKLSLRGSEIWGSVDWTPRGSECVVAREYRYISPAFMTDPETGAIIELVSAALTNRPALTMPALTRVAKGHAMKLEDLLKLLGLDPAATKEQIADGIAKLKASAQSAVDAVTKVTELEATHAKSVAELASAKSALDAERAKTPGLDKFVPRADYDAALARVVSIEKRLEEDKVSAHKAHVDVEIDAALKAGKISPATKDFYVSTCGTPAGLEQFRKFVGSAPVIAPDNVVTEKKPETASSQEPSAEALAIAARCGISKETFVAAQKA